MIRYTKELKCKQGFVLEQFLFAMLIVSFTMVLLFDCLRLSIKPLKHNELLQDEIGILQLRRIMHASKDFHVSSFQVCFTYHQKEHCLQQNQQWVYLTPGFVSYLLHVDSATFYQQENQIFIQYVRGGKQYQRILVILDDE